MIRILLTVLIYCFISVGHAQQSPLPVDQVFAFSASLNQSNQLVLKWNNAADYFLYRDQLKVSPAVDNEIKTGNIVLPAGQTKKDSHGVYKVYSGTLTVLIPLVSPIKGLLALDVRYQGCSSQGFCYAPVKKILSVNLSPGDGSRDLTSYLMNVGEKKKFADQGYATDVLGSHHIVWIISSFLLLGLLLAFTPCVLPMIPILSSIIVDQGRQLSTKKAFLLSLAYVIGMALAYALAGIVVALMGSRVQIALQQPWVIVVFSGLFVLLALSLFGLFDIKLPNAWHQRLVKHTHKHKGGTYLGVFLMGAFSTLIVSPCVSAPLVGALAYIGNSGSIVLGGAALFSLGIGMGLPLLLIGTSAGKFLPKVGPWMDRIKQLFGLLMLALAIWMLMRILPSIVSLFLWSAWIIVLAIFIWRLKNTKKIWHKVHQGLGLILISYAFILMGGAVTGNSELFRFFEGATVVPERPSFTVVKNMTQLDEQLALAKNNKKQVLLDFYADWCASCVAMDHHVFKRTEVKQALTDFVLLRADITKNNPFDQAVLKRFQVIAPPTMVFFDARGNILSKQQIVGEVNAKDLLADLSQMRNEQKLIDCNNTTRSC